MFSPCSICLFLFAFYSYFPPGIVGVATFRFAVYQAGRGSWLGLFIDVPNVLTMHKYLMMYSPPITFFAVVCRRCYVEQVIRGVRHSSFLYIKTKIVWHSF